MKQFVIALALLLVVVLVGFFFLSGEQSLDRLNTGTQNEGKNTSNLVPPALPE